MIHYEATKRASISPDEKLGFKKSKLRLTFIRAISMIIPGVLFATTVYYGTHSLIDNYVGLTVAFLAFALYCCWEYFHEMHQQVIH
jgi:ABC-type glycerol-3-phosphate transport system permease component